MKKRTSENMELEFPQIVALKMNITSQNTNLPTFYRFERGSLANRGTLTSPAGAGFERHISFSV